MEGNRIMLSRKAILKEQRAKMGGGEAGGSAGAGSRFHRRSKGVRILRKAMSRTSIAKARRTKWWSASVLRIVDRGPVVAAARAGAADAVEVEVVVAAAVGIMAVVTAVTAEAGAVVVKNNRYDQKAAAQRRGFFLAQR